MSPLANTEASRAAQDGDAMIRHLYVIADQAEQRGDGELALLAYEGIKLIRVALERLVLKREDSQAN